MMYSADWTLQTEYELYNIDQTELWVVMVHSADLI